MGFFLLEVLYRLLYIYSFIILAAALVSWIFLPPTNPVIRFLKFLTEPVLAPCRQLLFRILPSSWRRFDFSPVLAFLLIQLLMAFISYLIGVL